MCSKGKELISLTEELSYKVLLRLSFLKMKVRFQLFILDIHDGLQNQLEL